MRGRPPLDVTGQRYGRLVALRRDDRGTKSGGYCWFFRCDCGRETVKQLASVRSGATTSCGCLRREMSKRGFGVPKRAPELQGNCNTEKGQDNGG